MTHSTSNCGPVVAVVGLSVLILIFWPVTDVVFAKILIAVVFKENCRERDDPVETRDLQTDGSVINNVTSSRRE